MSSVVDWQPLGTLYKSSGDLIQHESQWLNTGNCHSVILNIHVLYAGNIPISFQTSDSLEGPWTQAAATSSQQSSDTLQLVLSRDLPQNDSNRLRRYVRWCATGYSSGEICFRVRAQLNP